jgi:hypothetical protein
MAGGRLTIYKLENAEMTRQARVLSATNDALAGRFEVCRRTIDNWIATIPEFSIAVRQGREVTDESVVSALFARATGDGAKDDQGLLHEAVRSAAERLQIHSPRRRSWRAPSRRTASA